MARRFQCKNEYAEFSMRLRSKDLLRAAFYVNGRWVGTPTITIINPATGETVSSVPKFDTAEAKEAVAAAKAAFPTWSGLTALDRSAILRRWFDLIAACPPSALLG
jgi:succinate-semialdehyde dehydrogenase/glutarate-semialdehyde dehydrogenase